MTQSNKPLTPPLDGGKDSQTTHFLQVIPQPEEKGIEIKEEESLIESMIDSTQDEHEHLDLEENVDGTEPPTESPTRVSTSAFSDRKKARQEKKKQAQREAFTAEKEAAIMTACHAYLDTSQTIQREIKEYLSGDSANPEIDGLRPLLGEVDLLTQNSSEEMLLLTHKVSRYSDQVGEKSQPVPEKKKGIIGNIIFYVVLLGVVLFLGQALATQTESGVPKNIAGYAPMTILTGSMRSVYPKDSLVIAKVTEPKELKIGDDITFMKENNTTVTHRIVGITENYQSTGERGFETKGVNNPRKDDEVVIASNVIGKIVYSSKLLGSIILFIRANLVLTIVTLLVMIFGMDWLIKSLKNSFEKKESIHGSS